MNRGRIEQIDRPEAIFENPQTPFVAEFVGVSNLLPGVIISSESGNVEIAGGIKLHAKTDRLAGENVLVGLRPENAEVFAMADAPTGAMPCAVIEAVYQGAQISLELAPLGAADMRLRARLPTANRSDRQIPLRAGEHIAVRWRQESVLIYPCKG
jgi:ABC-type Fe3+/spermidine/putrescine transport system ATPase subunit